MNEKEIRTGERLAALGLPGRIQYGLLAYWKSPANIKGWRITQTTTDKRNSCYLRVLRDGYRVGPFDLTTKISVKYYDLDQAIRRVVYLSSYEYPHYLDYDYCRAVEKIHHIPFRKYLMPPKSNPSDTTNGANEG